MFDSTPIAGVYIDQTEIICSGSSTGAGSAESLPAAGFVSQELAHQESLSETDTMRPHAGGIDFPAGVVCGLELNGYVSMTTGGWSACAHSTQNLPAPHTPAAGRRRPGRTDRQLK
jgi:hypothetical protein